MSIETGTTRLRRIVREVRLVGWMVDGMWLEPSSREFAGQIATLVSIRDMDDGEKLTGYALDYEPRENAGGQISHRGWLGASHGVSKAALGRWHVNAIEPKRSGEDGETIYRVELAEIRDS